MNYDLINVYLPIHRCTLCRVFLGCLAKLQIEYTTVQSDIRHVHPLFPQVNVIGNNPKAAHAALHAQRLYQVCRIDAAVLQFYGFHTNTPLKDMREVEVNEDRLYVNHIGRRLLHMKLSELQVERKGKMHAADGHYKTCLLLKIGSEFIHRPPLHGWQVEAGGKQHNEQYYNQQRLEDNLQRTTHPL